jgi:hypothetical protein
MQESNDLVTEVVMPTLQESSSGADVKKLSERSDSVREKEKGKINNQARTPVGGAV